MQWGRKGPGLMHWRKDGCWHNVQPDAQWLGKAVAWVTVGQAAGVGVRGDIYTWQLGPRAGLGQRS